MAVPEAALVEELKKEPELKKPIMNKKIRIALLTGYNGMEFSGSQKNKNVRNVEEELEKGLFAIGMISHFNYGDLKKIGWGRATRTDKKVHALQNTFSAKVLVANKHVFRIRNAEGVITAYKPCSLDEHLEDLRE